ncbi:uncharacterized protein LOC111027326 [Myzus persicae]|uniref:uncharacterized protein LOC111027326 n=1 Tax=Myzus persicae TaxID=13164 RepID=UPI000B9355CD|nr:uncharacterized protein LOC111027326 [Myzus persicae]
MYVKYVFVATETQLLYIIIVVQLQHNLMSKYFTSPRCTHHIPRPVGIRLRFTAGSGRSKYSPSHIKLIGVSHNIVHLMSERIYHMAIKQIFFEHMTPATQKERGSVWSKISF